MIKLTVLAGPDAGSVFTPGDDPIVIGRSSTCEVVLHDGSVSRRHCMIERRGESFIITDLQSANGTFVNDLKTRIDTHALRNEDEIILGKSRIRVELPALAEEVTKIAAPAEGGRPSPESPPRVVAPLPTHMPAPEERLNAIRQPDVPIVVTVMSGPDRGIVYSPAHEVLSIGRADTCDIVLHDPRVSRVHATIKREAGHYRLYDENSGNGTFLRTPSARIFHADLADGDVIYLGQTQLRVDIHLGKPAVSGIGDATIVSGTVG